MDNAFDLIIFGATGDLVTRKIIPAMYNLYKNKHLTNDFRIISLGRKDLSQEDFIQFIYKKAIEKKNKLDLEIWQQFTKLLLYIQLDANNIDDYYKLGKVLRSNIDTIFYLSTAPTLFAIITEKLAEAKLNQAKSRIVLEKPLGHNLTSSNQINDSVAKYFHETQIFRIDHYLGKESVQNLMAIRFGNTLFEALWRRQWINSIQITIAEDIGVEGRGEFYDKTGALRDMLQNHLLQLLCIVAMEPPFNLDSDTIRDEKLKVLKSLKILTQNDVQNNVIRGQYKAGAINGQAVCGYNDEENVPNQSNTETFVALKAEIQNWRWAGVPFYLRTGKRMQEKIAEIVIQFKELPCKIFPTTSQSFANRLIIKLQPKETVQLFFLAKKPGDTNELQPVYLDLNFANIFDEKNRLDGYERLLLDVIRNKLTLFVRRDEQQAAWAWVEPILKEWENSQQQPRLYTAGTWGPATSSTLLARDNENWHEEIV
jgi:glucose-6-phosphate 1-dehydrogenase